MTRVLSAASGRRRSDLGRIVVGCVAENNPKYLSQALRLVQSIRWFSGGMADAKIIVCIVAEVDNEYRDEFRKLGAFVKIVPRFSSVHPQSNKLRFLELPEIADYDTVMLMDCDTIFVQDPLDYIDGRALQARIAGSPTVSHKVFEKLFSHWRLPLPLQEYRCAVSEDPTIWYCNAGVIIFPQAVLREFYPVWRRFTTELCQKIELLEDARNFCEQASLSLSFVEQPVPFKELPITMNCPVHPDGHGAAEHLKNCDPVIIHYHQQVNHAGLVLSNSNPYATRRIDEFNQRVQEDRRKGFSNRRFWDFRYEVHPDLGSGRGSRGESLKYKQCILNAVLRDMNPETILDIGCGDQLVTAEVPDEIYCGIDLSSVIIARNREKYPKRRYITGDFLDKKLSQFEMTLCFDVLIHMDSKESYLAFIERIVSITGVLGIISGYEKPPSLCSSITFFYESLSQSLNQLGIKNIRNLGAYRETDILLFSKRDLSFPDDIFLK